MNPNAVMGLGSKLNTSEIIDRFIKIEKRRLQPVEQRKEQKLLEADAWGALQTEISKLKETVESLDRKGIWEAKTVTSGKPEVIVATGGPSAEPGKTTIAVDSIATSHQISSQGYEFTDVALGTGRIRIQVGEGEEDTPVFISITEENNTLEGIKNAINDSGAEVEAFIAKTYGDEPNRLLLTSNRKGEEGKIRIEVKLEGGEVDPPDFLDKYDETAEWEGVQRARSLEDLALGDKLLSSTPVTEIVGDYTGEEDNTFTFKVVQAGVVPGEKDVVIVWEDELGRNGELRLNRFNYKPGNELEIADGLKLRLSQGEVVNGDTFEVKAFTERSPSLWWLNAAERAARVEAPSEWQSNAENSGIKVFGDYTGEEEDTVFFRIEGSGQVGGKQPLFLHYEFAETGESGKLRISEPYGEGIGGDDSPFQSAVATDAKDGEELFNLEFNKRSQSALAIGNGLFVEVPLGLVADGDTASIEVQPKDNPEAANYWWNDLDGDGETSLNTGKVDEFIKFEPYDFENDDNFDEDSSKARSRYGSLDDSIVREKLFSSAEISIGGDYTGGENNTYTFTVQQRGAVGVTTEVDVKWEDELGNEGVLDFGVNYVPGDTLPFDAGLTISLGEGELVAGDTFEITTTTATVRKAQDLVLRLGASRDGGGLEVRRNENNVDDLIPGVNLEILDSSEDPITISVVADQERARELIQEFVDAYNTFNATATEVTKYDASTQTAAPLLSDRTIAQMVNELATTVIGTVPGLPQTDNMLFALGIRINDKGVMSLDEQKLDEKINEDFVAVSKIFRSYGESDEPTIAFVGMSDETKVSASGYSVDIQKAATRATLKGEPVLNETIVVNETNNAFYLTSGNRRSEKIELRQDVYNLASLAKEIQGKLREDKVLGKRGIRVEAKDGQLQFTSEIYGSKSTLDLEPAEKKNLNSLGLGRYEATQGEDVVGTIDGLEADGRGQLLVGKDGTDADGLRLFVTMLQDQVDQAAAEANVVVTKGIAVRLKEVLRRITDPVDGDLKQVTKDLTEQLTSYDKQIRTINERIDAKREQLMIKFAKLDSTMGRLKAQQNYLSQQLSALGGGGKKKDDK
jgi:flagellar capping protein FliD